MPGFSRYHDNFTTSSASVTSGRSTDYSHRYQKENHRVNTRRLSLLPPVELTIPPPAPSSSIHDSDATSVIKTKINKKPFKGEGHEEYFTTKKVHVKTTKNTEKLVRRQVVLEDGRVLEEEEPHIIVDTIEDSRTREYDHIEDRDLDVEIRAILQEPISKNRVGVKKPVEHKFHSEVSNTSVGDDEDEEGKIVDDSFQRTINSKDVKENIVKTQVAQDLGLLSRRGVERILRGEETLREVLERRQKKLQNQQNSNGAVVKKPVVKTYQADSRRKIVDTEDVRNISRRLKNGNIKTEVIRTEKHEIFDDKAAPDDEGSSARSTLSRDVIEHDGERYHCAKREQFTDFFRVKNGEDQGSKSVLISHGPHVKTEERQIITRKKDDVENWEEVDDERIRIRKQQMRERLNPGESLERTDALTKRPLNFFKEEKTRKKETDRWLERHFGGSEWSLLTGLSFNTGTTATSTMGRHPKQHLDKNKYLGSMIPEAASRVDSIEEKNLRRTKSFSAVPQAHLSQDFARGGERIVRQTTTRINPGLEKVVYSSVTKAVAAAPSYISEERGLKTDNQRLYRSALSLNNIEKKANRSRDDKFLRGSTTSLIQTPRDVPITIKTDKPDSVRIDQSPTRPPRKSKPSAREIPKKDLFFDYRSPSPANKLRTSTSYSELARTSMMNSSYLKQQRNPKTNEVQKSNDDSGWKHRSYFFGEKSERGDEKLPIIYKTSTLRIPRTQEKSTPAKTNNNEAYLRVQSEPPSKSKTIHFSQEVDRQTPKVRRIYPTIERKISSRNRDEEKSNLKSKRSQSQQPLYRTELKHNSLYPPANQDLKDFPEVKFTHMLDDNIRSFNTNQSIYHQQGFSKSHNDLYGHDDVFQRREDDTYATYYGDKNTFSGLKNHSNLDYYNYRNMERSDADGWDSPVAWLARDKNLSQTSGAKRSKSFMVGHRGSAGESSSFSSSSVSNELSRQQLIDPPPYYRTSQNTSNRREKHTLETSKHHQNKGITSTKSSNFSPSMNIHCHYDHNDSDSLYGRSRASVLESHGKPNGRTKESSSKGNDSGKSKTSKKSNVYEFEKRVPMHSSSLEAQKFKTIIFLNGR